MRLKAYATPGGIASIMLCLPRIAARKCCLLNCVSDFVSTIENDVQTIRECIQSQEKEGKRLEQFKLFNQ
jgi:hypothetical protein